MRTFYQDFGKRVLLLILALFEFFFILVAMSETTWNYLMTAPTRLLFNVGGKRKVIFLFSKISQI